MCLFVFFFFLHLYFNVLLLKYIGFVARCAGSDGSMSTSGSADPGFDPRRVVNFHLKIFNLVARRGGDVHFLIARLYIQTLPQYVC